MVSASVGFQCPDCVNEGNRTQRAARTLFGGTIHVRDGLVTSILVGVCVATWLVEIAAPVFVARFEMFPLAVAQGQWYRLITAGFLHANFLHILLNMWALWIVGRPLETMLGRARYIGLYGASLIAGSTASYLFDPVLEPSLGASGAIFGLFGALVIVYRRLRLSLAPILAIVVVNAVFSFTFPGIDWHAHAGGFVAGLAVAGVYVYAPRQFWSAAAVGAVVVVVVVCAFLVGVRSATINNDPAVQQYLHSGGSVQPPTQPRPIT
jgi:membrane associated rhomboid family serine protease